MEFIDSFDQSSFRHALSHFATGVTIITTQADGPPYGMTANAFASVSLDPPLVLVCVVNGTEGAASIEQNGVFAVNVLSEEQESFSRYFASKGRPRGWETFATVPHEVGTTGSPILKGAAAFFDCRLASSFAAGDHIIYIGEVVALGFDPSVRPLLFHHGHYRRFEAPEPALP
jgi:flavin reductase (DIM6/NTAB) family NADH-FMN oxidoreductase RutF